MAPIRFGIISHETMGERTRQALTNHPDAVIVATCNLGPAGGAAVETADWQTLLSRDDLDAIFIATPNAIAPAIIIEALGKGLHVFCQHLPGYNLEDVINVRRAEAAAAGKILKFSFGHRYHGAVMKAHELAESGTLGSLLSMRGTYGKAGRRADQGRWENIFDLSGGGILMDRGIHMIDLMHMFAGPFEEIKALVDERFWMGSGVEDNAMALLRTNSGVMALLHASATQWRETFRLELGFEKGYLWLDGVLTPDMCCAPEMLIIGRVQNDEHGEPIANPEEEIHEFKADESVDLEIADFISTLQTGRKLQVGTSQQAFDAINTSQRLYAADPTYLHKSQEAGHGDD